MMARTLTVYAPPALALLLLVGCQTDSRDQILRMSESQVALREIQSRTFDASDRNGMLRDVIATLQDLSFVIDKADATLGSVSATKLDGYQLRMTVIVRRKGEAQLLVRANAQYDIIPIEDPEPYQQFFAALQKAIFLAEQNEKAASSAAPLAKEAGAEAGTLSASAVGTTASPAPFDGAWLLEIGEASAMQQRDVVRTIVSNGKFAVRFDTNGWNGRLEGEISESGLLVAQGTLDKKAVGANWYKGVLRFTAPYQGDGFRQTVQSKARVSETFKVSLRRE